MMEDSDLDTIREFIKHRRKYASDFEWFRAEKHLKEVGVVRCLLESISKVPFCEYRNLRPCEIDPPDCLANNVDGALVGFEVRELVDQEAIELNEKGKEVYRYWTDLEVIEEVAAILREKDSKKLRYGSLGEADTGYSNCGARSGPQTLDDGLGLTLL